MVKSKASLQDRDIASFVQVDDEWTRRVSLALDARTSVEQDTLLALQDIVKELRLLNARIEEAFESGINEHDIKGEL